MDKEEFDETALPKASGAGAPAMLKHTIYKTSHGIVQGWTTVKGKPVAIVQQRSTYNHDIDSVVGFLGFANPHLTHDAKSWMTSAAKIGFTFNWFYADDRDTATSSAGWTRSATRPRTRRCRRGAPAGASGAASCRRPSTRRRSTRSRATSSAGTTSRRRASRPTVSTPTARPTAR